MISLLLLFVFGHGAPGDLRRRRSRQKHRAAPQQEPYDGVKERTASSCRKMKIPPTALRGNPPARSLKQM